jgi:hypothetical protein
MAAYGVPGSVLVVYRIYYLFIALVIKWIDLNWLRFYRNILNAKTKSIIIWMRYSGCAAV